MLRLGDEQTFRLNKRLVSLVYQLHFDVYCTPSWPLSLAADYIRPTIEGDGLPKAQFKFARDDSVTDRRSADAGTHMVQNRGRHAPVQPAGVASVLGPGIKQRLPYYSPIGQHGGCDLRM